MKKTLTINLGGTVYYIDEDAYHLLDNYLTNLRIHFCREEGAEEIVHDIELRISELFTDRLNEGKQVITIEDVEEIIARMGKPEDLSDEESGVASGLAAYMGWDVTWVRIILLVLGFFVHGVILAYIIAWIIIPMAHTAPEKLAMKGAAINVENIGKTVTDGFEKVNDYVRSDRPRSILQKIGEGIVSVAGFLIKFLLVFIAICCAPVLFVLLIVFFALLMAATGLIAALPAVLYRYSYYRTDTHADASFWRLATHVHCNQNYIYRIVAHRVGSGCFLCTE